MGMHFELTPERLKTLCKEYPGLSTDLDDIEAEYKQQNITKERKDYLTRRYVRKYERAKAKTENEGFEPVMVPLDQEYLLERFNDPSATAEDRIATTNLLVFTVLSQVFGQLQISNQLAQMKLQPPGSNIDAANLLALPRRQ
jgi:hypothetical protein